MEISSNFDGGKVGVVAAERAEDIRLKILPDNAADFAQWFYYRLTGARGQATTMTFVNAAAAADVKDTSGMPDTWEDYQVLASYDRRHWFRIPTDYDHETLRCRITPEYDSVFFATFVPHSMERHHRLVARAMMSPRTRLSLLGRTPDGQDLDLLYERGRSLQEEIASRLGEATNRNLYVLSIVTTIFLPMTLITGLFGINVGGMPWLENHLGFWWVVFGMFATAIVTFLILHWRRLF